MKTIVLDVLGIAATLGDAVRWMQEGKLSVEGLLTLRFPIYGDHRAFTVTADKAKLCSKWRWRWEISRVGD